MPGRRRLILPRSEPVTRSARSWMMGAVSFDLYAFPAPGPGAGPEARQLLETAGVENRRFDHDTAEWFPRPGPEMATFMDELERRWPSLEGDPDGSPWASWPLWQPVAGGGTEMEHVPVPDFVATGSDVVGGLSELADDAQLAEAGFLALRAARRPRGFSGPDGSCRDLDADETTPTRHTPILPAAWPPRRR